MNNKLSANPVTSVKLDQAVFSFLWTIKGRIANYFLGSIKLRANILPFCTRVAPKKIYKKIEESATARLANRGPAIMNTLSCRGKQLVPPWGRARIHNWLLGTSEWSAGTGLPLQTAPHTRMWDRMFAKSTEVQASANVNKFSRRIFFLILRFPLPVSPFKKIIWS